MSDYEAQLLGPDCALKTEALPRFLQGAQGLTVGGVSEAPAA